MIHPFCKVFIAAVFLTQLNTGCRKSIGNKSVNYIHSKVLELKTGIPIPGALVKLYKCAEPSSFGCRFDSIVDVETTDSGGNFQYDSKLNIYSMTASHKGYIDAGTGGIGAGLGYIYLTPLAHTKIHLVKQNPHPDSLLLAIALDIDPAPLRSFPGVSYFPLANDTTVVIGSSGNNNNTINWYFTDINHVIVVSETGGQIPDYYINRFDTAFVELHY